MRQSQLGGAVVWVAFYLLSAFVLFLMLNSGVVVQSVLFLFVIVLVMKRCQLYGVLHPLSWFSIFYYLYSISYPMHVVTVGGYQSNLDLVIPISFLAYLSFSVPVLLLSPRRLSIPVLGLDRKALDWMIIFGLAVCLALLFYVLTWGVTSKREFLDSVRLRGLDQLFKIFLFITLLFSARTAVRMQRQPDASLSTSVFDGLGICVFVLFIFAFGVTGERDYLFRLVLLLMLVTFYYKYSYRYYYLLVAVFALVLILPFSQAAKGYFISGGVGYEGYEQGDIFNTEFASAGRNIHYVITRGISGYGGETFVGDVKRYFSFLYPDQQSTTAWFNDYVRNSFGEGGTSGWGFSLVAEGYVNFGWYGPILLFFFIGVLTAFVYRFAGRKDYGFLLYLLYVPTLIYVVRADLSNLLSLAFKVNLILVLLIFMGNRFLRVRVHNV